MTRIRLDSLERGLWAILVGLIRSCSWRFSQAIPLRLRLLPHRNWHVYGRNREVRHSSSITL